jgi:D-glycerate 3-kinase
MTIAADLSPLLDSLYLPFAAWLHRHRKRREKALVVGLCGAQGSGKSTVSALLQAVLASGFNQRVVTFSIDDIYKTRAEREAMAREVHPLFATRGVPGTHEVNLGIATIASLQNQKSTQPTAIPAFDKARDDRHPENAWPRFQGPVDVIIFEGWCVGALPQPEEALMEPINGLEARDDPSGAWRKAVNQALDGQYRKLFALIDVLLMLKVDSMHSVFEWRRLQERKLAQKAAEERLPASELRLMSDDQLLDRFIMHYERLTRHILSEMPARADIVFPLDATHNPAQVLINKPLK